MTESMDSTTYQQRSDDSLDESSESEADAEANLDQGNTDSPSEDEKRLGYDSKKKTARNRPVLKPSTGKCITLKQARKILGFRSLQVFPGQFKKDASAIEDALQKTCQCFPLGRLWRCFAIWNGVSLFLVTVSVLLFYFAYEVLSLVILATYYLLGSDYNHDEGFGCSFGPIEQC